MKILKELQQYMEGRKALLPLAIILSAISSIIAILPFIFIWQIIKIVLKSEVDIEQTHLSSYAWWAFGSAVASIILYFLALMLSHLTAFRVETKMRSVAMHKLIKMPLGFFETHTSGQMRKVIDDDAGITHQFVAHQLPDLAGSILTPAITLLLILVFNWQLGLACIVPIVSSLLIMKNMMGGKGQYFMKKYMDAQENMSSEAVEYVRGIPVVKAFQQSIFSFKRFYGSIVNYKEMVIKYTLLWQRPMSAYTVIINGFAFFLIPVGILVMGNTNETIAMIADLFLYLLITPVFGVCIMKSMYLHQSIFLASEALGRAQKLTNTPPLSSPQKAESISETSIHFEKVCFHYPDTTKEVLQHISFNLPQGKTYALVGPSGGGKTTIARLIPRFWDVDKGEIRIGKTNVKNTTKEELMKNISFVFQNTKLFKRSLLENITYGKPNASLEEIEHAIKLSQSQEIIDRLPDGLNTKIGIDGTYLSGGEQQRVALARALLKDAPIVVLDEATAFADPENEHLIQQALKELMKGKTVILIAHRLPSVEQVDKILVIKEGQIVEEGNHTELLAQKGVYTAMWSQYQQSIQWTV